MSELAREEPFSITNDSTADWAIRKIAELQNDTAKWKNYYDEQLKKIKDENDGSIAYFSSLLHEYFTSVPHKTTKAGQESYSLPSGKLVQKPQQPEYIIKNDELVAWFATDPAYQQYIKQQAPKADWEGFKKNVMPTWIDVKGADGNSVRTLCAVDNQTGEVVPGIIINERADKFEIKVTEEKNNE